MEIDPKRFVFLDECGVATDMTRRYGRARRGQRIHEGTPDGRWRTVTLLGAVSMNGWQAVMTVEAATDGDVFLAYLREVLCPTLQIGQVVVMDNLSAHKVDGVRELIEATGAELRYLPPYSPDFNPIEHCWSVVKQHLRQLKARSLAALEEAIPLALALISPAIALNCFTHCGYALC
jgi:transposase